MITVYYWTPQGIGNDGHSSLKIHHGKGGHVVTYLSWWPNQRDKGIWGVGVKEPLGYGKKNITEDDKGGRLYSDKHLMGGNIPLNGFQMVRNEQQNQLIKSRKETRSADTKFEFNQGFNETKMTAWIGRLRTGETSTSYHVKNWFGVYWSQYQNCHAVVAHALKEGLTAPIVPWPNHSQWHHKELLDYCRKLQKAQSPPSGRMMNGSI